MTNENRSKNVTLSSAKVYRLIKIMTSYKKELNKQSESTKNKSIIHKLNVRRLFLNSILENEGLDVLIDNYTTKLIRVSTNNANKKGEKHEKENE